MTSSQLSHEPPCEHNSQRYDMTLCVGAAAGSIVRGGHRAMPLQLCGQQYVEHTMSSSPAARPISEVLLLRLAARHDGLLADIAGERAKMRHVPRHRRRHVRHRHRRHRRCPRRCHHRQRHRHVYPQNNHARASTCIRERQCTDDAPSCNGGHAKPRVHVQPLAHVRVRRRMRQREREREAR